MNIYISTDGNDLNDGKSSNNAIKSFSTALERATDNDTIIFLPGTHILTMTKDWTACIHDENKILTIKGYGLKTILKVDNPNISFRDIHFLQLFNPQSKLINCTVDYNVTNRNDNYSRSIFGYGPVKGNIYNVNFIIRSCTSWSYDNSNKNNMSCFNCTFTILNGIEGAWSGNKVKFEKCAFKGITEFIGEMTGNDNKFNVDLSNKFKCNYSGYGIYYGKYPELVSKYLIKQNNKFYSIKKENYNTLKNNFEPIIINYAKYGFTLDDLITEIDSLNILGKSKNIDEGYLYEFELNNYIKSINEVQ